VLNPMSWQLGAAMVVGGYGLCAWGVGEREEPVRCLRLLVMTPRSNSPTHTRIAIWALNEVGLVFSKKKKENPASAANGCCYSPVGVLVGCSSRFWNSEHFQILLLIVRFHIFRVSNFVAAS
jgi:hypothetical protein